jgi:hypothetical protein
MATCLVVVVGSVVGAASNINVVVHTGMSWQIIGIMYLWLTKITLWGYKIKKNFRII